MRVLQTTLLVLLIQMLHAQTLIQLPPADKEGGIPLMQALQQRESSREFSAKEIDLQDLSDLCWAAWGINRSESGKRTAPSSRNFQEIELYVVLKQGVYIYNAVNHQLELSHAGDFRQLTGTQGFVGLAPLNFVFVADLSKRGLSNADEITDARLLSSWANAGFMSQNVYLVCASKNMATVVRALIDREAFAKALKLNDFQKVILAQTIGYKP